MKVLSLDNFRPLGLEFDTAEECRYLMATLQAYLTPINNNFFPERYKFVSELELIVRNHYTSNRKD